MPKKKHNPPSDPVLTAQITGIERMNLFALQTFPCIAASINVDSAHGRIDINSPTQRAVVNVQNRTLWLLMIFNAVPFNMTVV